MSLLTWTFESRLLRGNTAISVILPDLPRGRTPEDFYDRDRPLKVLWLLHGTFGDHSDWIRKTNIELYAAERGIAVVIPSALNSNYSNWPGFSLGYDAYDFLTDELMPIMTSWFPISSARENNFIAGLSMGGRGAVKYAVNHPEKFAAAAVLSASPIDLESVTEHELQTGTDMLTTRLRGQVDNAGGLDAYRASAENVWAIIDRLSPTGTLPRLLFATGKDDELAVEILAPFRRHAEEIGLDAEFWTPDGFRHEWRFWDLAIQRALDFFDLPLQESNPF
ncbi:putative tributyrin esterase [Arthrobacter ulcerisalmonis]|nr:alpha/beta hydrolase family protein [Arthrobacter ulcerisalmonis]MDQ0664656.1 putative tributyrin esterase [Arthrobacter ulcerisalmonis]